MADNVVPIRSSPVIGRIYVDAEHPRPGRPPKSARRQRLDALITEAAAAVFDQREEQTIAALRAVLAIHEPWHFFRQVFAPRYVGEEYLGAGCRACGEGSANHLDRQGLDCWAVRVAADAFGIQSDIAGNLR